MKPILLMLIAVTTTAAYAQQDKAPVTDVIKPAHPRWELITTRPSGQLLKLSYQSKEACEKDISNIERDYQSMYTHCDELKTPKN